MSIRPPSLTPSRQARLPWPGADEACPKCQGHGDVYYLHARQPWVEVLGGKRVICPVCESHFRIGLLDGLMPVFFSSQPHRP